MILPLLFLEVHYLPCGRTEVARAQFDTVLSHARAAVGSGWYASSQHMHLWYVLQQVPTLLDNPAKRWGNCESRNAGTRNGTRNGNKAREKTN